MGRCNLAHEALEYGGKTDKYEWDQTEEEVTLWFQVPENTRGRDVDCVIKPHNLRVALKGQAPILEVTFCQMLLNDLQVLGKIPSESQRRA